MNNLFISLIHTSYPNHKATILGILEEFQSEHDIRIELDSFVWESARFQLVEYALHKTGPVVSEIGSTWLSSLVSMGALLKLDSFSIKRVAGSGPLTMVDFSTMTNDATYLPSAWHSVISLDNQVWAIPWTTDTRMIFYRRDLLEAAGIDETTAFDSPAHWRNTLEELKKSSSVPPILLNTVREPALLHKVASWVWAEGGHFMQKGGRRTSFNEPAARRGFNNYFKTFAPFVSEGVRNLSEDSSRIMFQDGGGAVIVTGQWLLSEELKKDMAPVVRENLGVATLPVTPFVGGTHLIVWEHGHRQVGEALMLIERLTSFEAQRRMVSKGRILPSRKTVLTDPHFTSEFGYEVISQSLQRGASFDASYMWGLVEDRLTMFVDEFWKQIFQNPGIDLEGELDKKLRLLAQRLDRTLQSR